MISFNVPETLFDISSTYSLKRIAWTRKIRWKTRSYDVLSNDRRGARLLQDGEQLAGGGKRI